jgi:transposase
MVSTKVLSGHEYTMDGSEGSVEGRRRRKHSAQFKLQVMQACRQPGVSIASVALSYGLNANLVRRWLNGRDTGCGSAVTVQPARTLQRSAPAATTNFVPVQIETAPPAPADIRLELRRAGSTVIVNWPSSEAGACGTWLREWLR